MNRFQVIPFMVALTIGLGGCAETTVRGPEGTELSLVKPSDETVMQGETGDVLVKIDREDFEGPVEIEVADLPDGVNAAESETVIPSDEESVVLRLHADPDAVLVTNHEAMVKARAPNGMQVAQKFRITVRAR